MASLANLATTTCLFTGRGLYSISWHTRQAEQTHLKICISKWVYTTKQRAKWPLAAASYHNPPPPYMNRTTQASGKPISKQEGRLHGQEGHGWRVHTGELKALAHKYHNACGSRWCVNVVVLLFIMTKLKILSCPGLD